MRVITGSARGAILKAPEGTGTRPTGERVKEAVFSMIQFEIEGRRVLDLFAGSGQLGIEALSRGAESATFLDADRNAVAVIKQNLMHTRLFSHATVLNGDYESFLAYNKDTYDIVFIDPPYSAGLAEKALGLAAPRVSPQGVIVVETHRGDYLPQQAGRFSLATRRNYGITSVSLFRQAEA